MRMSTGRSPAVLWINPVNLNQTAAGLKYELDQLGSEKGGVVTGHMPSARFCSADLTLFAI